MSLDERAVSARRVAWFHCFSGIAGDMALGSLIDAGADVDEVRAVLRTLPFKGWELSTERVLRAGLTATRAVVHVEADGVERQLHDVLSLLDAATLSDLVRDRATRAFTTLAKTEGAIHGLSPEDVHFHEVGGHDAIIDLVGTFAALEILGIDEVEASAVAHGQGTINSRHGLLPNPPPAVVSLLSGVPCYGRAIDLELTTPTGAVILVTAATRFGALPEMTIEAVGYGAGGKDIDGIPNCTQVVIGTRTPLHRSADADGQTLLVIEANLDDATGEQISDTIEAVLRIGALDAWVAPVLMKKGRPGQVISVLCEPTLGGFVRACLIAESGSFGARSYLVDRWAQRREFDTVDLDGETLRMKVSGTRAKVEHDDAAALAQRLKKPVREIVDRAEDAYRSARRSDRKGPID